MSSFEFDKISLSQNRIKDKMRYLLIGASLLLMTISLLLLLTFEFYIIGYIFPIFFSMIDLFGFTKSMVVVFIALLMLIVIFEIWCLNRKIKSVSLGKFEVFLFFIIISYGALIIIYSILNLFIIDYNYDSIVMYCLFYPFFHIYFKIF